jgi:hypothetical protein
MNLILVSNHSNVGLVDHLRHRREAVTAHHSALEQTATELGEHASLGQKLALEYGLTTTGAELAWLDSKLALLSGDPDSAQSKESVALYQGTNNDE